jgi:hypothetical protein
MPSQSQYKWLQEKSVKGLNEIKLPLGVDLEPDHDVYYYLW